MIGTKDDLIVKADHFVMVGTHTTMTTKRVYRADGVTIEVMYRNRPVEVFPTLRFDCLAAWTGMPDPNAAKCEVCGMFLFMHYGGSQECAPPRRR